MRYFDMYVNKRYFWKELTEDGRLIDPTVDPKFNGDGFINDYAAITALKEAYDGNIGDGWRMLDKKLVLVEAYVNS